jgi:ribosomal peptide maturation radical SAM protein 1
MMGGVALISMPWSNPEFPSVQLGLFRSIFRERSIPLDCIHFDIDFVGYVGYPAYNDISHYRAGLFAEWLFSKDLFGSFSPPGREACYIDHLAGIGSFDRSLIGSREEMLALRDGSVPSFLDDCFRAAPWNEYDVISFTCSFNQTIPSLALAKRIRAELPGAHIVLGGCAFDGELAASYHRAFPWIDAIFSGDADESFPEYVERLDNGGDVRDIAGISLHANGAFHANPPRPYSRLDESPVPDYSSYFERVESLKRSRGIELPLRAIPFETSRGCWWAERKQCTFCGLSSEKRGFRSKSAERVLEELRAQRERHDCNRFYAIEMIMDRDYKSKLLRTLDGEPRPFKLFFEVRPGLSKEDIGAFTRAGVVGMQPGIETYNTRLLRLMNKGVTSMQNVVLNKWATYYGIVIHYGILYRIPGEREEDYRDLLRVLPHLYHLQPPAYVQEISLDRFSPYFEQADRYGISFRTSADWHYLYPSELMPVGGNGSLKFEFTMKNEPDLSGFYRRLMKKAFLWRELFHNKRTAAFIYQRRNGGLTLVDRRTVGRPAVVNFDGAYAAVYDSCSDRPMRATKIVDLLARKEGVTMTPAAVSDILKDFHEQGFVFRERDAYLSLAHPVPAGASIDQCMQWGLK